MIVCVKALYEIKILWKLDKRKQFTCQVKKVSEPVKKNFKRSNINGKEPTKIINSVPGNKIPTRILNLFRGIQDSISSISDRRKT